MTYEDLRRCVNPHEAGTVCASLGLVSTFADVFAFRQFAREPLLASGAADDKERSS